MGVNKDAVIKLCNEINKKEGKGSIYTIGSDAANLKINRWTTGIEDLDAIIGGGMPEGRVIEIFGPESSGKTTLAYHLCGLHNLCLDIPIEGTSHNAVLLLSTNTFSALIRYPLMFSTMACSGPSYIIRGFVFTALLNPTITQ